MISRNVLLCVVGIVALLLLFYVFVITDDTKYLQECEKALLDCQKSSKGEPCGVEQQGDDSFEQMKQFLQQYNVSMKEVLTTYAANRPCSGRKPKFAMPEYIQKMEFGKDLPPLTDEEDPQLIFHTQVLRAAMWGLGQWTLEPGQKYTVCQVPQFLKAFVDETWIGMGMQDNPSREKFRDLFPCYAMANDTEIIEFHAGSNTSRVCRKAKDQSSLMLLGKRPSIYFEGVFKMTEKMVWMLAKYRTSKNIWVGDLSGESLTYYPILGNPIVDSMINFTVGNDQILFDVPHIMEVEEYYDQLRNPPPILPLSQRNDKVLAMFMASNCGPRSKRNELVQELMKHMQVDSYGGCLHNKDIPDWAEKNGEKFHPVQDRYKDKFGLMESYAFTLSFENSVNRDYVTEKLWQPLVVGSIPIYYGAPNVDEYLPGRKSIININDWASIEDLANYLRELVQNETLYNEYHMWREIPISEREKDQDIFRWVKEQEIFHHKPFWIGYCEFMHTGKPPENWPKKAHGRRVCNN